jgi:hypothetical protein
MLPAKLVWLGFYFEGAKQMPRLTAAQLLFFGAVSLSEIIPLNSGANNTGHSRSQDTFLFAHRTAIDHLLHNWSRSLGKDVIWAFW